MNKIIQSLLLTLFVASIPSASAYDTILINFSDGKTGVGSPDDDGNHWNNAVHGGEGHQTPLKLVNSKGALTPLTLTCVDDFYGGFASADNPQDLFPSNAGNSRWALERGKDESGAVKISGLKPNVQLSVAVFGTREAPVTLSSTYSVDDKKNNQVNSRNRNQVSRFTNIQSDEKGEFVLRVGIHEGQNAFLNVMKLDVGATSYRTPGDNPEPAPRPKPEVASKPAPAPQPPVASAPKPVSKPAPSPAVKAPVSPPASAPPRAQGSSSLFLILGVLALLAGLGLVGGAVWWYLKSS